MTSKGAEEEKIAQKKPGTKRDHLGKGKQDLPEEGAWMDRKKKSKKEAHPKHGSKAVNYYVDTRQRLYQSSKGGSNTSRLWRDKDATRGGGTLQERVVA